MWTYQQSTGKLGHDGVLVGTGYAGAPNAVNDPDKQNIHAVGPIPRGMWTIGPAFTDPHLGPLAMHLTPAASTETFGRTAFLIHADRRDFATHPQQASEGCIIMPNYVRQIVAASDDRSLEVVE